MRLLAEGYDIVSAGDGEEALAMAIKERPQLIVSDVMMPKISGFDMLDILRSTTETRDIKVIMMTALSSEDQRQRGEQLGADRYLVKSQVGIEDVVRTVHEVLADAPVSQSTFAKPAEQSAAPQTAAPAPAAPATPPPATPAPQPAVAPPPAPQPQTAAPAPAAPATPPPAPGSATVSSLSTTPADDGALPAPTAPFSSPRPATLGERVIQPMENSSENTDDIASRIAAELAGAEVVAAPEPTSAPAAPQPVAPTAPAPQPQTPPSTPPPAAPVA